MWASVFIILPILPFFPMRESLIFDIFTAVVLLAVFCTGLAYFTLLYFLLVADLGPSSALSVTFLIPVFGILWGHIFLDEHVGINTIVGSILVVIGTMLVTGFSPNKVFRKKCS